MNDLNLIRSSLLVVDMKKTGDLIKRKQRAKSQKPQNKQGSEEQSFPLMLPSGTPEPPSSSPNAEEEQVVIQVSRPAEERAGTFLKDWMRRFSRM